jgi:hypothetical protein
MNATTNLKQVYATYLRAGGDVRKALDACMVRGKLPRHVVNELAGVHSAYYKCHAHLTDSGAWRFFNDSEDTTSANRHEAATKQWNRAIAPLTGITKSKRGGARYKTEKDIMSQRDFVLKAFKLLSASDRKWVITHASE